MPTQHSQCLRLAPLLPSRLIKAVLLQVVHIPSIQIGERTCQTSIVTVKITQLLVLFHKEQCHLIRTSTDQDQIRETINKTVESICRARSRRKERNLAKVHSPSKMVLRSRTIKSLKFTRPCPWNLISRTSTLLLILRFPKAAATTASIKDRFPRRSSNAWVRKRRRTATQEDGRKEEKVETHTRVFNLKWTYLIQWEIHSHQMKKRGPTLDSYLPSLLTPLKSRKGRMQQLSPSNSILLETSQHL